jgi:catechol 2,3-dioxygenase-like lactoylglutathione lyase family enzyme
MHVESLDHIHVYCADPEGSLAFYRRHFEATEVLRSTSADGHPSILISLGGRIVILGPFPGGIEPSAPPAFGDGAYSHGFGVAHFGLRVADVRAAVRELAEAGVRVLGGPVVEPEIVYAYVAGPDGVVLELTEYTTGT